MSRWRIGDRVELGVAPRDGLLTYEGPTLRMGTLGMVVGGQGGSNSIVSWDPQPGHEAEFLHSTVPDAWLLDRNRVKK